MAIGEHVSMASELTKQDFELFFRSNQEVSDKVVIVLKDVAVQFNMIVGQLVQIARSEEDILNQLGIKTEKLGSSIKGQVSTLLAQVEKAVSAHQEATKHLVDGTVGRATQQQASECQQCRAVASAVKEFSEAALGETQELSENAGKNTQKLIDKLTDMEKQSIKSRTMYIVVIGTITAAIGMATAIVTLFSNANKAKPTPAYHIPINKAPASMKPAKKLP
jgi:ElaB/YqjD/DUF883 family membrane-anchored ribosome-binding protein